MVLTKKLDALEEFRIQREQLMAKFEDQETKVEQQKEMYESQIYEQEKKHIKEEDRLKKDMMTKLESVASEFRKAANAQMSATTQRSSSSHVFTIPESTIFFQEICFVLFFYKMKVF